MYPVRAITAVLLFSSLAPAADPAVWPQWRGPARDGTVTGPAWPDKLEGAALERVWRVEKLGPSYSGPIVATDRVFTTQTVDKKTEVVTAHDRKTGKELWKTSWEGSITVPFFAAKNGSWIRSTPAFDGQTLFVAGITDVLVALDGGTGKEVWRLDFVKEFGTPVPDFGFVCSPLVDDAGVYVQAGGGFVKVDKKTGKVLWRALKDGGGTMGSAFSSPVFAKLAGADQVVVQTRTKLAGVGRDTGKELWSKEVPSFRGMNILTPVPVGADGVLTSTYGGNTRLVRVKNTDGTFDTSDAWALRYEGYMCTPVVVGGHAYVLGKDKRLVCVDVRTGKEAWGTDERFGDYWSLVANKDRILALDSRGILYLFKADPKEFDLIEKRKVAESETWAHLAVCGDEIFIRDLNGLSAWRWSGK
ncbi:outer membrane biogenesis protein BamB [Gemmata sp. SH-PL17]|uniref:PQQ-binding-like beta-propeller repeat protein n=1 Tax=Gemmata sp. SH-PL17 TaxID=1630693 RepID=UPI0004B0A41D|nr:PQQ-binding-like beta-propeller repeat protein [Gemmata sp. SH-PL17]AMV25264.1 outer membrane biogenesis protein BamB [Gemmata sp. SH-PL17]